MGSPARRPRRITAGGEGGARAHRQSERSGRRPWTVVLRPDAGNVEADPVEARACRHVEGLAVRVAPGEVRRELGRLDRPQVLAFLLDDPGTTETRDVEIAAAVHLH